MNNVNTTTTSTSATIAEMASAINAMAIEIERLRTLCESLQQQVQVVPTQVVVPAKAQQPATATTANTTTKVANSSKVVIPNKEYLEVLSANLQILQENLGENEYRRFKNGLMSVIESAEEEDYYDGDEIMNGVHDLINRYVYGSFSKVATPQWQKLESYLHIAGYVPVDAKVGDDVTPYRTYFDRPIPTSGGVSGTIKSIQLRPYTLVFEDRGEMETLKLCGRCVYYN